MNWFGKAVFVLLSVPLIAFQGVWAETPTVTIDDPVVPLLPPGAKAMAAYMIINNNSDKDRSIVALKAAGFGMAHFHKSHVDDGIAKMEALKKIDIPAGKTVALEPGALHIMLMMPDIDALASGTVELTLTLADGEEITASAQVLGQE